MNNRAVNGAFLRYLASCSCRNLNLENLNMFLFVYTELINADAEDASCSSTPSWRIKKSLTSTYVDEKLQDLISDQWKNMEWQRKDPSTDFRGAGFISLENLRFFAKTFSTSFQRLLKKQGGKRAAWEYPFAVAGVNITFMIMQMLDLEASKPRSFIRLVFLQMLSESEWAFGLLYCVAFVVMDKQWLDKNATYMEFNLERELMMDDVFRIEDMPSFSLLS
ncbi:putative ELMO domain-containing protein [Arabidopsis thaliana]